MKSSKNHKTTYFKQNWLTFPKRNEQFSHSACTFCLVSQFVHTSSVTSFLFTQWLSFSSWQKRHVYILLQQGVWK